MTTGLSDGKVIQEEEVKIAPGWTYEILEDRFANGRLFSGFSLFDPEHLLDPSSLVILDEKAKLEIHWSSMRADQVIGRGGRVYKGVAVPCDFCFLPPP